MTDLIEKYSVKLDNIDFMGRADALTGRRTELLEIVLKIQKKLQGLTKVEKQSKNQTGLIVEVKGGKLKINESAVQNLLHLCFKHNCTDKYGFAVVSIVGERESGKSRLFKSIQNHAVGSQWEILTPSEGTLESSGIICRVLCVDEMEKRRLIFLMDIVCDQSCNSEIYMKLVDFCTLTSGVVLYTEKKELDLLDPRNPCYWNEDRSFFTTSPLCESSTLNNPYVLMFKHDCGYVDVGYAPLLQVRSDRIQERKREKEAPQHFSHSIAVSLEENGQESSCSSPSCARKTNLSSTNETKLYNENLLDFFQETEFFQEVTGNDLDFVALERLVKLFVESTNMIEREFLASTDRFPSSAQLSAEEDTTLFSMNEENTKLAVKKALEKYDTYMRCQTEHHVFTDSKIQEFHKHAHSILTSETVLPRFETRQWEEYLRLVNPHLGERRHFFIIQNQTRITEKAKVRKMHLEEGKTMYSELLSRYPASDSYDIFVHSARTFAWELYKKKAKGKCLNVTAWKQSFLSEIEALSQQVLVDKVSQRTPQISLEDFSREFRKLELCLSDEKAPVSLVFHLSPSSLQAAVFTLDSTQRRDIKSDWNSPVFRDHWPPCILFRAGGTTLIGKEALNSEQISGSGSFFNVYEMLRRGSQVDATVVMNKKEETLEVEEIVAMFLFKIKRQIETELNIHLTSAAFAMCSLFSTSAKHMVKTSLSLAGFQDSVLLQSRTAAMVGVGEHALRRGSGRSQSIVLFLHDESEIIQLCILGNDQHLEVKPFINLMSASISSAYLKETIIQNLREMGRRPTSAIMMPMSPLVQQPPSQAQRRLTTALAELKQNNRDFENCEILIKNVGECWILLGAHLYSNPTCDQMKGVKINESNCNVFGEMKKALWFSGFFRGVSVCKFSNDSDFFNQTNKTRMVLNVKMGGKDELYICEDSVGRHEDKKVATLTRANQDDRKEIEIEIHVSSEGLLDFQLKSQGPHSEVDVRVEEEFQIVTKYLRPLQVEGAKNKLSKYFKTRKIKIEDSWKTFVKNTDSMSKMDEVCGDNSDL